MKPKFVGTEAFNEKLKLAIPYIFFAICMFWTLSLPPELSFDETHYVPASKKLINLEDLVNWEHPPLGKLLMGFSWKILTNTLDLCNDLMAMRLIVVLFGLATLYVFQRWLSLLKVSRNVIPLLVWSVGFNITWYVQSKTAMLDVFYVFFGLLALKWIYESKNKFYLGFCMLGLSFASKWSALAFLALAFFFSYKEPRKLFYGLWVMVLSYYVCFIPYTLLEKGALPFHMIIFKLQLAIIEGMKTIATSAHSYRSDWWQWLTLHRPIWYTFLKASEVENSYYTVLMTGNPFIQLPGVLGFFYITYKTLREKNNFNLKSPAFLCSLLFLFPIALWIISPRKLTFFYYIYPSCFWFGPMIWFALEYTKLKEEIRTLILRLFVVFEAVFFFFMLPMISGQKVPADTFFKLYHSWMLHINWI